MTGEKMTTPSERLQGTVDVLVLKTLASKPMHGYAIAQFLAEQSRGELAVEGAALYQGLHRLERKGLIKSRWGVSDTNRRVRIYGLTRRAARNWPRKPTDGSATRPRSHACSRGKDSDA